MARRRIVHFGFDHDLPLGYTRRTGTTRFDSLVQVILNDIQVANNEELNPDVVTLFKANIEAKFMEEDVVLTVNKFIEQKGRIPCLSEFHWFINSWEDKLINENKDFRQENRALRDEKYTFQEENRALRAENAELRQRHCQN